MTDLYRSKMIMSDSKDRLRKALLENVDKYTISSDGRVLSDKSTLISAFKNELEKGNKIKGKTAKKVG
ncbi:MULTISPECIES: hypothetical protein [unclassified Arsenophonus]|uniref:hypothetical protein n=1 Tax=unclassified Arsenophonus TaxID=2627083 RepID=UPI00285AAAFC|nr:hypothetical protein [Arsenophonus sp.]MDR5610893.1 hypothetical protein [Arsenophonus sp.]MDR5614695.1 hypothetical protein [Arsenophonus sp.]